MCDNNVLPIILTLIFLVPLSFIDNLHFFYITSAIGSFVVILSSKFPIICCYVIKVLIVTWFCFDLI